MGDWGYGVFQDDHALDTAADIREAADPNAHIEDLLRSFLEETAEGYDKSEDAEDWYRAREVMAACEIVRLGLEGIPAPDTLQPTIARWLTTSQFRPTPSVSELALQACRRLAESDWLKKNSPQRWTETFLPLQHQLEAAVAKLT